jgi:SagB-type dehydrogenase family enzyme
MTNRDIEAAWSYHDRTKHSVASVRESRQYLDWEIKPRPFKVYPNLEAIPLPRELPPSPVAALAALEPHEVTAVNQPVMPDLISLARVLHFSAGILRRKVYPGGEETYFRAAACTGALYHIDLYVICGDLPGLSAGVFHFGPHNFALHQLRAGDYRGALVEATGSESSVQHAPVILACTSTYWRNSWKYQARTYRHCFWDAGTLLANLFAVAAADAVPAHLVCGFVDDAVNRLIGLDTHREAALALVSLGYDPHPAPTPPPMIPPLAPETLPLSPREVDYPAIRAMHAASSLRTPDEVKAWRAAVSAGAVGLQPTPGGTLFPLRPLVKPAVPTDTVDRVILRRGSSRRFSHQPIQFEQLSALLHRAARGAPSDAGGSPNDLYLIVNAVEGLPGGAYVYRPANDALDLLRAGDFRREAGFLGLGQELPADAAVNVYWLCNLEPVLARFGNRGYRIAQLDAAVGGGRLYLAAYALGLGATGLTFFDDEVTAFFSPDATGKSVMFLIAIGRAKRTLPQAP